MVHTPIRRIGRPRGVPTDIQRFVQWFVQWFVQTDIQWLVQGFVHRCTVVPSACAYRPPVVRTLVRTGRHPVVRAKARAAFRAAVCTFTKV